MGSSGNIDSGNPGKSNRALGRLIAVTAIALILASCSRPFPEDDLLLTLALLNTSATTGESTRAVYITSGSFRGDLLGGTSGADTQCNSDAARPAGTYRALIADPGQVLCNNAYCNPVNAGDQIGTILQANTSYNFHASDGSVVSLLTTDSTGVVNFGSGATLSSAMSGGSGEWWTGLAPDWTLSVNHCSSWAATTFGETGVAGATDADAISFTNVLCSLSRSLVCVQQ